MTWAEVLYAIGAVLAASGGIILIWRELSRRTRRSTDRELDLLSSQLNACREDSIAYRMWAYDNAKRMTAAGLEHSPAPKPTPRVEPLGGIEERRRRWLWRKGS